MKKALAVIIGLQIPLSAKAEGWPTLGGTNSIGDTVFVYPAWDSWEVASGNASYDPETDANLFYVDVRKNGSSSRKPIKRYNDLRCEFKGNNPNKPNEFSCKKSGKSPLVGATYKIVPNKNPKDCTFKAMFICTSGCNDATTPRKMTQDHWECEE